MKCNSSTSQRPTTMPTRRVQYWILTLTRQDGDGDPAWVWCSAPPTVGPSLIEFIRVHYIYAAGKDAQILVLRHQLAVLRARSSAPVSWSDPAPIGALPRLGRGPSRVGLAGGTTGGAGITTRRGEPWITVPSVAALPEPINHFQPEQMSVVSRKRCPESPECASMVRGKTRAPKRKDQGMFSRWAHMSTTIVVVAGVASLANPALAGAVSSSATGTRAATPPSVHRITPPRIGVTTSQGPCTAVTRPPVSTPPVTAPPHFTPGPPKAPGLCPLQASQSQVMVSWYNQADNASSFIVYSLDSHGNQQQVDEVPAHTGTQASELYSWTDTGTDQSGQCYIVAAVNSQGKGDSPMECTVRPNPSLPDASVVRISPTLQWSGLTSTNDGTGQLINGDHGSADNLIWKKNTFSLFPFHCGCGVDLAFTSKTSLWKVQAIGGPVIMYGEAVALRVWGGGWLEYAHQTWGVSLHLVSTPVYQWYLLGQTPGTTIDTSGFALWNSAVNDFLIEHGQTYVPDIEWLKRTLPTGPPPTTSGGVRQVVAYNCYSEDRPLEMWADDETAGTGWTDMGIVQTGWSDDGCGETADDSWTFSPTSGHTYEVRAVDFDADGCSNDPTLGQCVVSSTPGIVGNPNGGVETIPIDD